MYEGGSAKNVDFGRLNFELNVIRFDASAK
jgi:hypothetical protein